MFETAPFGGTQPFPQQGRTHSRARSSFGARRELDWLTLVLSAAPRGPLDSPPWSGFWMTTAPNDNPTGPTWLPRAARAIEFMADSSAAEEIVRGNLGEQLAVVERRLAALAQELTRQWTGESWAENDPRLVPYLSRLRTCLQHHHGQWSGDSARSLSESLERLQADPAAEGGRAPLHSRLFEVCLAQALADNVERAAELFQSDYLPPLRRLAHQMGGEAAVELADSLPADLILPRPSQPPRIASYQGRAPLLLWLRAVLANLWTSQCRRRRAERLDSRDWPKSTPVVPASDVSPCGDLLRQPLQRVLSRLDDQQRLILSMLILDHVPQQVLARNLGIHSGTLTRRRQQAFEQILAGLRGEVLRHPELPALRDCLDSVLAGADPEARAALAQVLATEIAGHTTPSPDVSPSAREPDR